MEAEVFVLEADAGGLEVGDRAELVITAHPGSTFGATVRRIDPIARAKDRGSPVQYFAVVLELDETDTELMKPGQRVETRLLLADLENVLVVPRQAIFMHDESPHVWLQRNGGFEEQPVQIGARSPGRAVVESGLDRGDVIEPRNERPGFRGVRDVAGGYTWVEYETGEREFYDLRIDPHQLDNRADDPRYSTVRDRLSRRLDELRARAASTLLAP